MSLTFTKRESVFTDLEDVHDGELYLGWIAPSLHGKRRNWWQAHPVGHYCQTVTGREAAVKCLTEAAASRRRGA